MQTSVTEQTEVSGQDSIEKGLDRVAAQVHARDQRDLLALVAAYPIGAVVRFRTYDPTIWPRDWRRLAERAPWGFRRGDRLEVMGYGATQGFPEALVLRRITGGSNALTFPAELESAPS